MVKATFRLDEKTVVKLEELSLQCVKSKSVIVCDAIAEYWAPRGPLSQQERNRMLRILDAHLKRSPERSQADVDRELRALRAARRGGGRKTRVE